MNHWNVLQCVAQKGSGFLPFACFFLALTIRIRNETKRTKDEQIIKVDSGGEWSECTCRANIKLPISCRSWRFEGSYVCAWSLSDFFSFHGKVLQPKTASCHHMAAFLQFFSFLSRLSPFLLAEVHASVFHFNYSGRFFSYSLLIKFPQSCWLPTAFRIEVKCFRCDEEKLFVKLNVKCKLWKSH